ncbi:leader peptide processing enzyme [Sphaerochaeta sp. PS]|uniref:leader peptide processing enzyme n=1 Tax=Sphaerochaeta sp. PS TaxID=3076336 RepID=UPI0028A3581B|nr:leader peptide processing enzyme [Sphaerochaeta sp. PS]MDT4762627.1 leader peptide processing enzyme [Sphaerochaeta sp. PS]
MSKKTNTLWFMVAATVLNIVLMLVLFLACFILITRFVDPASSLVPLWLGLSFLVSIGGSFWLYSVLIKWMAKRFNLEENLAPLFNKRKKKPRREE